MSQVMSVGNAGNNGDINGIVDGGVEEGRYNVQANKV